ncbi:MAG: carboxypeptidase-like regulatory domain-containing protein [Sphingobacteriaceae bacterium]|nr:MAG: carboxypeptidase-like regulatory domain-containing protein [Sphingobacteriaceae bacterium]
MKKFLLLLLLPFLTAASAFCQQFAISGKITDEQGNPVPFTSIYLKNTTLGTSANDRGLYEFKVASGTYDVVYRYVGFKEKVDHLTVGNSNLQHNVVLSKEIYQLKEVSISGSGEDPAYAIIRKTIGKRNQYLTELQQYSCDVYIKGVQKLLSAPKKILGRDVQKVLQLDSNRKGIIYLSESESHFNFAAPDKVKEIMVSSKIAGRNNAFSFNRASDLQLSFYKDLITFEGLSNRGFISPIAGNALFYYRYKLLGRDVVNGQTVDKIQVIPRREFDPVFRGNIYIVDGQWRIYSVDLHLTKAAQINFVDTLNLSQQYIPVTPKIWQPTFVQYSFNGKVFGFKFDGYFIGIYKNYDDTSGRKQSKQYLDSVEKANNHFKFFPFVIAGFTKNDRYNHTSLSFPALYKQIHYNTVEGFAVNLRATYTKSDEYRRAFSITPNIRYGFANKLLSLNAAAGYRYDPINQGIIFGKIGSDVLDLNNMGTQSLLINSIGTLLYNRNFVKLYRSGAAMFGAQREVARGLLLTGQLEYVNHRQLYNTARLDKINQDNDLTSNNPLNPAAETQLFPEYQSLIFSGSALFTFKQQYTTRPDGRFYEPSKYPQVRLSYRKAFSALGGDESFDYGSINVFQNRIRLGLYGYSSFSVSAGKFFTKREIYYPDYKHFRGNQSTTFNPQIGSFHFLDFYPYSTNTGYLEGHYEHNFSGFLFNKVPFMRKLKLEEIAGASYLTQSPIAGSITQAYTSYSEFYVGIQRLIFRVDYGIAYNAEKRVHQGFRIFYGF